MVKKRQMLFLILVMVFLCACGRKEEAPGPESAGAQEQSEIEQVQAEDADEDTGREPVPALTDFVNEEEMSAADQWPVCDDAALAKVMRKARAGEAVTVACIGGSITQGTIARGPKDGEVVFSLPYAEIFRKWWEDNFPESEITFVNAGIGGTDSYLGVHRAGRDILSKEPDVVLIEYAVNDADNNFYKRSYENLLRNCLLADGQPAVMLLFMAQTTGVSAQSSEVLVGYHYAVPMISYANCIKQMKESGHYTAQELSGDQVHPSALGHAITGELLWKYLNQVYLVMDDIEEPGPVESSPLMDDRYRNASVKGVGELSPEELGSFTPGTENEFFPDGWTCIEGEGGLTVKMTFRNLGILYLATKDGKSGEFEVWIDGEAVNVINADFSDGWGNAITAKEVYSSKTEQEHTVVIKKAPDSERDVFILLGFLTS